MAPENRIVGTATGIAVTLWFKLYPEATALRRPALTKLIAFYNYVAMAADDEFVASVVAAARAEPPASPKTPAYRSLLDFVTFCVPLVRPADEDTHTKTKKSLALDFQHRSNLATGARQAGSPPAHRREGATRRTDV